MYRFFNTYCTTAEDSQIVYLMLISTTILQMRKVEEEEFDITEDHNFILRKSSKSCDTVSNFNTLFSVPRLGFISIQANPILLSQTS